MDHSLRIHVLQQLWKDVSQEIVVNSPRQTWWKAGESQKSVFCNACMETQGRYFEQFIQSVGSNSETLLQKTCDHKNCFLVFRCRFTLHFSFAVCSSKIYCLSVCYEEGLCYYTTRDLYHHARSCDVTLIHLRHLQITTVQNRTRKQTRKKKRLKIKELRDKTPCLLLLIHLRYLNYVQPVASNKFRRNVGYCLPTDSASYA